MRQSIPLQRKIPRLLTYQVVKGRKTALPS
jgi:hypothetical protein